MQPDCTRRHGLKTLASLGVVPVSSAMTPNVEGCDAVLTAQAGGLPGDQNKRWKGSALDNLQPSVKQEQERTGRRLAFLNQRPKHLEARKAEHVGYKNKIDAGV